MNILEHISEFNILEAYIRRLEKAQAAKSKQAELTPQATLNLRNLA